MVYSRDLFDCDGWRERLGSNWGLLNPAHDVEAFDDKAEGGKALAIGVAGAAEVEFRLRAYADEKVGGGCVG